MVVQQEFWVENLHSAMLAKWIMEFFGGKEVPIKSLVGEYPTELNKTPKKSVKTDSEQIDEWKGMARQKGLKVGGKDAR